MSDKTKPMNNRIEKFIDEVKTHSFWFERLTAKNRILELYRYAKKLEKKLAQKGKSDE
jgi:hypothetical protein